MLGMEVRVPNDVERLPKSEKIKKFVKERKQDLEILAESERKGVMEARGDNELQLARSIGMTGYFSNIAGFKKLMHETLKIQDPGSAEMQDYWMLFGKVVIEE